MQIQFIFKFNVNYAETTVLTIPMINIGTNIFLVKESAISMPLLLGTSTGYISTDTSMQLF